MKLPTEKELAGLKTTAAMVIDLLDAESPRVVETPRGSRPNLAMAVEQLLAQQLPDLVEAQVAARSKKRLAALTERVQELEQRLERLLATPPVTTELVAPAQLPELPRPATHTEVMAGKGEGYVTPAGLRYALDRQAARLRGE